MPEAAATTPLLELDRISKSFGRVVVAEELSLTVGARDIIGIVGPNGAGKTSLFEVAKEAFTAVSDPHDKAAVAAALHKVSYTGMCGPIDFAAGPAPGVGIIKPVGVQWKKGTGSYPFEMQVVDNSLNPSVKVEANLDPTNA